MRNIILVFLVVFSLKGLACNCLTIPEAQKRALATNKLILLHFDNRYDFDDDDKAILNTYQYDEKQNNLIDNYIYVCIQGFNNVQYFQKYNIEKKSQLLIIDANGEVVYQFIDFKNPNEFVSALLNFDIQKIFLTNELKAFYKNKNYNTAVRVAQKYLDYSLLVEPNFRKNLVDISKVYLTKAENNLSKKDLSFIEKQQKLELFKLYQWAYVKNFALLEEKLAQFDSSKIHENNIEIYYFLKYISAKGLKSEEFNKVVEKTSTIEGFDYFIKKANTILELEV